MKLVGKYLLLIVVIYLANLVANAGAQAQSLSDCDQTVANAAIKSGMKLCSEFDGCKLKSISDVRPSYYDDVVGLNQITANFICDCNGASYSVPNANEIFITGCAGLTGTIPVSYP